MATFRQMRALAGPFLALHPEYVMRKRVVFRVPFRHFRMGMTFDSTGHSDEVYLSWFVFFGFGVPPSFTAGISDGMDRSWGELGTPNLQKKIVSEMEKVVSGILTDDTRLETMEQVNSCATSPFGKLNYVSRGLLYAALGDFARSISEFEEHLAWMKNSNSMWRQAFRYPVGSKKWEAQQRLFRGSEEEAAAIGGLLDTLTRGDEGAVAHILHAWEIDYVQKFDLERYWEPSPFPLELT